MQIPVGYEVTSDTFVASAALDDDDNLPNGGVTIAGEVRFWEMALTGNKGGHLEEFNFDPPLAGPTVSVGVNVDNFKTLDGNVTLHNQLTDAAREGWAQDAYGRVAEYYEQLRREYEQAVIQATANQPPDASELS